MPESVTKLDSPWTVVFDGECGFCGTQIERIRRRDVHGFFDFVPRQTEGLTDRFPRLAEGDFNTGMRLVAPDGRVFVGADAFYEIARRVRGWRFFAWMYRVPGIHGLARAAYAWVARNRHRLSPPACAVTPRK